MSIRRLIVFAVIFFKVGAQLESQTVVSATREWHQEHQAEILGEFTTLLSIPNIASDGENIRRNADALVAMLEKRGVGSRLLMLPGVNPVVFGEIKIPDAKHTIVLYAHY